MDKDVTFSMYDMGDKAKHCSNQPIETEHGDDDEDDGDWVEDDSHETHEARAVHLSLLCSQSRKTQRE